MQVDIKGLKKNYDAFTALDGVTMTIPSGAVLALAGPNGAGKTTMMKIIAGLGMPTSGTVYIGDLDVSANPRQAHEYLGFLGDFFGLYDDLTVREFLLYFARAYRIDPLKRDAVVARLIQRCRLEHKADTPINSLSRGLRQRVGIARTLVNDPPVILLDEPSAGLDPEARNDLQNLFKDLGGEGKTLIVSSHILTELEDYCTHVALLNKGRLASFGEIATLRKAQGASRRILIEIIGGAEIAANLLSGKSDVVEVKKLKNSFSFSMSGDESAQADLLAELVTAGVRLTKFSEESGRIQEAYLTHMKGTRE